MIKSFALQNFKKYRHQEIDISKKITILVGPNSSGKSSIIKSLLAFKQTYEDQSDHSGFLARGDYVDIGPFVEYVHDHEETTRCRFVFNVYSPPRTRGLLTRKFQVDTAFIGICHENDPGSGHGRLFEYSLNLDRMPQAHDAQNIDTDDRYIVYRRMQKSEESFKIFVSRGMYEYVYNTLSASPARYNILPQGGLPNWNKTCKILSTGAIQAYRDSGHGMACRLQRQTNFSLLTFIRAIEIQLVQRFQAELFEGLTAKLYALAALREEPQRSSARTDEKIRVGARGQNTTSVYVNFRERAVKAGGNRGHSKIRDDFERLHNWIERLNLTERIDSSSWRHLVDLRTKMDSGRKSTESVVDIGVGFSQAWPILVQLATMPESSYLILEQPELHLFPWAQSEMGRILCEESRRSDKNIIVETHSEHIVRGVQAHVSNARPYGIENFISNDEVQVLYVQRDGNIKKLEINEFGEFSERWPGGFFDPALSDFQEITQNKMIDGEE